MPAAKGETRAVLFLDVDGVLNNLAAFTDEREDMICPTCLANFKRVIAETGCIVVLSSAWRGIPGLEAKLAKHGVMATLHDTDPRTPNLDRIRPSGIREAKIRGDEIADWLRRHPEVERYAIVDDDEDMRPEQMPFFVRTKFESGLNEGAALQLIEILNAEPSHDR